MLPYKSLIHEVPTKRKAVAFTFDDGPNPLYTPQVLEMFRQVNGKATFFMIGCQMEQHPEVVKAVHAEGHEIGNHTFTHPFMTELHKLEAKDELLQCDALIERLTGARPNVFRPPYFDQNEMVAALSEGMGYRMIGAMNMEAHDWEMPGSKHIYEKTWEHVKPGSIFLFHDGFDDRSQTMEAVSMLLPKLVEEGYELLTVSELIASVSE